MKTRLILGLILLGTLVGLIADGLLAATPPAETKALSKDVKCPVTGKPINPADFVEYEKAKVYFCCENCPAAFKKDTAKYAAKAHLQMVQTGQLKQVACPFTGKPLNPETAIDVGGVKVAFCCKDCEAKAKNAKGDEQIALVFKDVSKGFKLATEEPKK
jgi:YHS domain-containing protein